MQFFKMGSIFKVNIYMSLFIIMFIYLSYVASINNIYNDVDISLPSFGAKPRKIEDSNIKTNIPIVVDLVNSDLNTKIVVQTCSGFYNKIYKNENPHIINNYNDDVYLSTRDKGSFSLPSLGPKSRERDNSGKNDLIDASVRTRGSNLPPPSLFLGTKSHERDKQSGGKIDPEAGLNQFSLLPDLGPGKDKMEPRRILNRFSSDHGTSVKQDFVFPTSDVPMKNDLLYGSDNVRTRKLIFNPGVYTILNEPYDSDWLYDLYNISNPIITPTNDFIYKCLKEVSSGYIRYNYKLQSSLLPNLITLSAMLNAVLLEDDSIYLDYTTLVFDAVETFKDYTPLDATKYMYYNYVNKTSTLAVMNPEPSINPGLIDYIVKNNMFNYFLYNACIPGSDEYEFVRYMVNPNNNPWSNPIKVFGYNSAWDVAGYIFEAETNCNDLHNMGQIASEGFNNFAFFSNIDEINKPLLQNNNKHILLNNSKIYVSFTIGDGDNLSYIKTTRREWMLDRINRCNADPLKKYKMDMDKQNENHFISGTSFPGTKSQEKRYPTKNDLNKNENNYSIFLNGNVGRSPSLFHGTKSQEKENDMPTYVTGKENYNNCFPLQWSISPHLTYLSPLMLEWYYKKSYETGNDFFVLPPSGDLYSYPSEMDYNTTQLNFIKNTEKDCELLSCNSTVSWEFVLHWHKAIESYFPRYSYPKEHGSVKQYIYGIFAVNVPYNLPIAEFIYPELQFYKVLGNGVVIFKPSEWRGYDHSKCNPEVPFTYKECLTVEEMADKLNNLPSGAMEHIYVTSDGGGNLDMLYDLVPKLNENVQIVSTSQLIDLALQQYRRVGQD